MALYHGQSENIAFGSIVAQCSNKKPLSEITTQLLKLIVCHFYMYVYCEFPIGLKGQILSKLYMQIPVLYSLLVRRVFGCLQLICLFL